MESTSGGAREGPETRSGHLDPETVAAYVDGTLDRTRRAAVEAHLADCDACRDEVVAVEAEVRSLRRGGGRQWVPLAAAATLVGLVVAGAVLLGPRGPAPARFRDGLSAARQPRRARIAVVRPTDGQSVTGDSVVFAWRAAGPRAFYRFTLTDTVGTAIWHAETRDTVLVLPADVPLRPDEDYFWYVDTLLGDGTSATTDIVEFRVAPPR